MSVTEAIVFFVLAAFCFVVVPATVHLYTKIADSRWLRSPMIDGIPLPHVDDPRWNSRPGRHVLGPFIVDWTGIALDGKIIGRRDCYFNALQARALEAERRALEKRALAALTEETDAEKQETRRQ